MSNTTSVPQWDDPQAECKSCGHPFEDHQTGTGVYTGWCGQDDCECEWPQDEEDWA